MTEHVVGLDRFKKKPVVIQAMTFGEMVAYGRANGGNIVNGMPWSFSINGHAISHENDECYIISTLEGTHHMTPSDMLIIGIKGEIYPCKLDIFEATYDKVPEGAQNGRTPTQAEKGCSCDPAKNEVCEKCNLTAVTTIQEISDFIQAFMAERIPAEVSPALRVIIADIMVESIHWGASWQERKALEERKIIIP